MSLLPPNRANMRPGESGFTLIEVVVATAVLTIGLLSMAMLTTRMMTSGRSSKYMAQASSLASEKLEDLNRWEPDDPQVCLPAGSVTAGSLASDVTQTTTCATGNSTSVNYFDDVNLSFLNNTNCPNGTDGCIAETYSSSNAGGTVYTTTFHAPDGTITTSTSNTAPAGSTFHRRWIIEGDQPVTGVRRITLLITSQDPSVRPPVTFQMSMVRP